MIWEADIWCPTCKALYGKIYRQQVSDDCFVNKTVPDNVPKYCGVCEKPTERKPLL